MTDINGSGVDRAVISKWPISDLAKSISNGTHFAEIHIRESKNPQTVMPDDEIVKYLKKKNQNDHHVSAIKVSTRVIDGASGAIASMKWASDPDLYMPVELYDSIYFANFDPSHVMVEIASYYPWDNGTRQLLKTIHVEKMRS